MASNIASIILSKSGGIFFCSFLLQQNTQRGHGRTALDRIRHGRKTWRLPSLQSFQRRGSPILHHYRLCSYKYPDLYYHSVGIREHGDRLAHQRTSCSSDSAPMTTLTSVSHKRNLLCWVSSLDVSSVEVMICECCCGSSRYW